MVDVFGQVTYRDTKHCVCISTTGGVYLVINTRHREMYDDFEIQSDNYGFLGGVNRFVCCSKLHEFDHSKILKKVGRLIYNDMQKIVDKIQASKTIDSIDKDAVIPGLAAWLAECPPESAG